MTRLLFCLYLRPYSHNGMGKQVHRLLLVYDNWHGGTGFIVYHNNVYSLKMGQELEAVRALRNRDIAGKECFQPLKLKRCITSTKNLVGHTSTSLRPYGPTSFATVNRRKSRLNDLMENGSAHLNFPDANHLLGERLHLVGFLVYLLVLGTQYRISYSNPRTQRSDLPLWSPIRPREADPSQGSQPPGRTRQRPGVSIPD